MGSLACWQRKMECLLVCVCVCVGAVVCTCLSGGASDESRTLPQYFVWVYLFKRVVASSRNTACACAFVSEEGEECPARTQLSKHIPVSCLAPLLSRRNNFTWIYLFILPRPGPTSSIGFVVHVLRCWGNRREEDKKERLEGNTSHPLIISFSCRQEAPAIHLPILGPESLQHKRCR